MLGGVKQCRIAVLFYNKFVVHLFTFTYSHSLIRNICTMAHFTRRKRNTSAKHIRYKIQKGLLNKNDPKSNSVCYNLKCNNAIAGRLIMQHHTRGKKGGHTYLYNIEIFEPFRGKKLCKKMLTLLFKKPRCNDVYLTVDPKNIPAMKCYRSVGFKESQKVNNNTTLMHYQNITS